MQQASHVCHRLIVSKEGDIDTPSSLGVNGADADGVESRGANEAGRA